MYVATVGWLPCAISRPGPRPSRRPAWPSSACHCGSIPSTSSASSTTAGRCPLLDGRPLLYARSVAERVRSLLPRRGRQDERPPLRTRPARPAPPGARRRGGARSHRDLRGRAARVRPALPAAQPVELHLALPDGLWRPQPKVVSQLEVPAGRGLPLARVPDELARAAPHVPRALRGPQGAAPSASPRPPPAGAPPRSARSTCSWRSCRATRSASSSGARCTFSSTAGTCTRSPSSSGGARRCRSPRSWSASRSSSTRGATASTAPRARRHPHRRRRSSSRTRSCSTPSGAPRRRPSSRPRRRERRGPQRREERSWLVVRSMPCVGWRVRVVGTQHKQSHTHTN